MFAGQRFMQQCAFSEKNIDSRKGILTRKQVKTDKTPVRLDRRRVSPKLFKEVDLGWLTR